MWLSYKGTLVNSVREVLRSDFDDWALGATTILVVPNGSLQPVIGRWRMRP